MKIYSIIFFAVLALFTLFILLLHITTRRPVRSILFYAGLGLSAFILINLTSRFTGVKISVNSYTVLSSAVFGAPAVCGMLLLNLIL